MIQFGLDTSINTNSIILLSLSLAATALLIILAIQFLK